MATLSGRGNRAIFFDAGYFIVASRIFSPTYPAFSGVEIHLPEMFVYGISSDVPNSHDGSLSAQNLKFIGFFCVFHIVPNFTISFGSNWGRAGFSASSDESNAVNFSRFLFAKSLCGAVNISLSFISFAGLRAEMYGQWTSIAKRSLPSAHRGSSFFIAPTDG